MIAAYVSEMDNWEEWQKEYKYGMLLIFPPNPLREQVNALRSQYDPQSQSACDAHISLTIPLPNPLNKAGWNELVAIACKTRSFPIYYGPLMNYLPHPGICLSIAPQAELDKLRIALESTVIFKDAVPRKYPFSAHMTIAEFISVEETETLMSELEDVVPSGEFLCSSVSYVVPDRDFHFTERKVLTLD